MVVGCDGAGSDRIGFIVLAEAFLTRGPDRGRESGEEPGHG